MTRFACTLLLTAVLANPSIYAQPTQRGRSNSRLPKVGTILPELIVFDGNGNEFSTKTLREHYSVLVFGCLT